jgi:hypothetical protein
MFGSLYNASNCNATRTYHRRVDQKRLASAGFSIASAIVDNLRRRRFMSRVARDGTFEERDFSPIAMNRSGD